MALASPPRVAIYAYASGVGRLFWIVGVEDALLFGDAR